MRFDEPELAQLRDDGWVLVPDVLTGDELHEIRGDLKHYFPDGDGYHADPARHAELERDVAFPFRTDALNLMFVHPNLLDVVSRVLGTEDVVLAEAVLRAKYRNTAEGGGKHHLEFAGKNSLAYPRDEGIYRQMPMILYLSDVEPDLGPTYLVSRRRFDGHLRTPFAVDRMTEPALYEAEVPVCPRAGSLLILSTRTYHRGSPVQRPGGARFSAFVGYHATACTWMETISWRNGPSAERELARFLTVATPRQRQALGFPPVDHPFWTDEVLDGVQFRFPDLDLAPYRAALAGRTGPTPARAAAGA